MARIDGKRILIMAADGFEQSELEVPRDRLREMGATVHVASPGGDPVRGWDETDWGRVAETELGIGAAAPRDYDALVLPGGQINPDTLRTNEAAVALVKAFAEAGRPVAAICHGPWLVIEAGLAKGRRMTSFESIRTDLRNAGAEVVDEAVVVDGGVITSRSPADLDAFVDAIAEAVAASSAEAA